MNNYIEQLNDEEFALVRDGRIIAVFDSFKEAKLIQMMATLEEQKEGADNA